MYEYRRVTQVFGEAERIPFDDASRIILISDCHRGDGSWADDFSKNQNIYFAALNHYYRENYTYIELGDGDELWKNKRFSDILEEHGDVFRLLAAFAREGRFRTLYGNHDFEKKRYGFARKRYYRRLERGDREYLSILQGVKPCEALVLQHRETGGKILLIHGHQADYLNDRLMPLAKFLVRYFWRPLESVGVNDPTSPAKNYKRKEAVERKLIEWVAGEKVMMVAGHTHRPVFPEQGEPPYFNDGSCIHPHGMTGIELSGGNITLVKWSVKTKGDGTLIVGRDVIEGPRRLKDYL